MKYATVKYPMLAAAVLLAPAGVCARQAVETAAPEPAVSPSQQAEGAPAVEAPRASHAQGEKTTVIIRSKEDAEYNQLSQVEKPTTEQSNRLREIAKQREDAFAALQGALDFARVPENRTPGTGQVYTRLLGGPHGPLRIPDKRISVDIKDLRVNEAMKRVIEAAGADVQFKLDGDLPDEPRISLRAQNLHLGTALDVVTQAAGLGWRLDAENGKSTYHVGKFPQNASRELQTILNLHDTLAETNGAKSPPLLFNFTNPTLDRKYIASFRTNIREQRFAFTCPHCKGQTTIVRQAHQPKCPKCGRLFEADWQFCPVDGAKRPPAPGEFRFCPLCGKGVDPDKTSMEAVPADELGLNLLEGDDLNLNPFAPRALRLSAPYVLPRAPRPKPGVAPTPPEVESPAAR